MSRFSIPAILILGTMTLGMAFGASEASTDPDENILKDDKIETDSASLLAFLRKKCGDEGDLLRMSGLVRQLGSPKSDERSQAREKLVALGVVAVPMLQQALRDDNKDLVWNAKWCLVQIANDRAWWIPPAVIRLLVRRQPEGTTEALLRYLPFAPEGDTEEEIWFGLSAMAASGTISRPELRKALNDPLAARRSLAACLLGRIGTERDRQSVRALLKDDDPTVRLRAAQGLLAAKDKSGISVLISLLEEPTGGIAWQAEELLRWIAGENSPKELLGSGKPGERKKSKDAWDRLWKAQLEQKEQFKFGEESRRPCLILVSGWDNENPGQLLKRIWLCGSDGTVRWQKGKISDLSCTGITGQGRVIVIEGLDNLRFREEDFQGQIVWDHTYHERCFPIFCRRLPNGETVVGGLSSFHRLQVVEMTIADWDGDRLESCECLLPNGRLLCKSRHEESIFFEVDPISKQIGKPVTVQAKKNRRWDHNHLQGLWNGNYLLVAPNEGKVMELTREGKPLWEYSKASSTHAIPLRGGSILVAAHEGLNGRLIRLNAKGKAYSEIIPHASTSRELIACFNLLRVGFEDAPAEQDLESVANLVRGLKSKDDIVRLRAACELEKLGAHATDAIPALVEALADANHEIRQRATLALNNFGDRALPHFLEAIEHSDPVVREVGAFGLQLLGQKGTTRSDRAVPLLLKALQDGHPRVRARAAFALGQYKDHASDSVPALIRALKDREQADELGTVCTDVLLALESLGPSAKSAIPRLLDLLSDQDPVVRRLAALALGSIDSKEDKVQKALVRSVQEETNNNARAGAAWALAQAGTGAKSKVPALLEGLKNSTKTLSGRDVIPAQKAIVFALGRIGPDAKEAVPALLAILREPDSDDGLRLTVVDTLGRIGPAAREAAQTLKDMMRDPLSRMSRAAEQALEKVEPKK